VAELAQAYVHLKPYEFDPERVRALGDRVLAHAVEAAAALYGGGVTVEVILAEGSGKFWATVNGVLVGAHIGYGVIADWKAFKEQVQDICNAAQQYGTNVCGLTVKEAEVKPKQVYRTERRLKTPGKLNRVLDDLEKLNDAAQTLPHSEVVKEISRIRHQLERVEADLSAEERELLSKALQFENLPPLREPPRDRTADPTPPVAMRDERDRRHRDLELDLLLQGRSEPPPRRKQTYHKMQFVEVVPRASMQDDV
jgi:hypothetical protein